MKSVHESNIQQPETNRVPFVDGSQKSSELSTSVSNARQLVSSQEALLERLQQLRKALTSLDWEASSLRYDVGIRHCSRPPEPTLQVPPPPRVGSKPPIGPTRETGRSVTRRNSLSSRIRSTSKGRSVNRSSSASEMLSDKTADDVHGVVQDYPGDRSPRATSPLNRDCPQSHPTRRSRSRRRVTLSGGIQTADALAMDRNSEPQPTHQVTSGQASYDHTSHPVQLPSTPRSRTWSYADNPQ